MSDEVQSFTTVWDAIADTPEEAANLRARADLLLAIGAKLNELDWSQTVTAANLGLTQPRVSDLVRGKISKFSLDTLVNIAARLGLHTKLVITSEADDQTRAAMALRPNANPSMAVSWRTASRSSGHRHSRRHRS